MKNKLPYFVISFAGGVLFTALVLGLAWPTQATGPHQGTTPLGPQLPEAPVGTGFTYQGYLEEAGEPAVGLYDFEFALFDAEAAGAQVGSSVLVNDHPIFDGQFNVLLDFGVSAFGSGARWLEIAVRPGASGGAYTTLTPRQALTPAPYAQALPNVFTNETLNFVGIGRDFRISGNEVFGIRYVGGANDYGGMYVETAHAQGWPFYGYATNGSFRAWTYYNGTTSDWHLYNAGIRLTVPNEGGLRIGPSANYSLVIINTTGSDGIRILDTGDDAMQIGSNPDVANYGVYIPSPGVSTYGLWPNTADATGEWALFTVDKIEAGNVVANAYSLVARVTGDQPLTLGDVVAVTGMADPIPGSTHALPQVRLADAAQFTGVIGVVESRMVFEVAPGKEAEGEKAMHSTDGPARPGDYVSLLIFGVAQVKVDPGTAIVAGQRLTASELAGVVRPLRTETVNGMVVTEGAPVLGIALAAPGEGQDTIPVFITLR
jgi:hypothetical protein